MSNYEPIKLLENATANGNGTAFNFPGGKAVMGAYGTFDGASVELEASFDGTNWMWVRGPHQPPIDSVMTNVFELPACQIRAVVADAGASTDITAEIRHTNPVR